MSSDRNHKTRTLWLCGILHAFTHLYQVALIPLYLLVQKDFKLQTVEGATFMVTLMGMAYFVPSYPMGVLADRMSRKKLMGIGLLVNSIGFVGLALSPSYDWALGWIVVSGFGGSFFHPAATSMVARLFPVGTGRALGLVGMGASIGFFVGPIYAGWRAEAAGSWRTPILELGLLGLVAALLFLWLAEEHAAPEGIQKGKGSAEKIFGAPALWVFFLLACLAFSSRDFGGSGMGSLSSLFLQKARGFSPSVTGLALSGIFLASAFSNPLFGGLSDRGRMRWLALVLSMAAVLIAVFPRVPRGWVVPTLMVYGFFFLSNYPMVEAALMESVHDSVRGRVFGLFITVSGLLGNSAHWAAGKWVRDLGPGARVPEEYYSIFGCLALLVFASLLGLPCLRALRKREYAEAAGCPVLVEASRGGERA